ncbi:MAG: hypothetical protein ACLP3R_10155 [Candidatus Korobacteraceae bacterium]
MTKALEDIEKLVAEVAQEAASGSMPLHEKMDALKLLQPYYAVLKKAKGKLDDDPSEGGQTMGAMRERLRVIEVNGRERPIDEEPADGGVKTASRRSGNDT